MREAVDAVNVQGMSISKAAKLHGIPRTTLNDHKLGKVLPGAKPGHPTLLTTSEEQDLVDFLLNSAKIGCARTRKEVLAIVGRMLSARGSKELVTSGWWNRFINRHAQLALRTPATLSISRARASTRECIDGYFDVLEKVLEDTGLIDHPALIFNMDETGFPLDPKPLKTVHSRGERKPFSVSSGSKSQVTVVACVSASGQSIPPLVIWKRKSMTVEMANGEIPGTQYGFSEKGWMQRKLFNSWFKKLFIRYAPASRPLLLLLDGHSSHYCPETLSFAAENDVIVFVLPPNTTHLTQPLDKGVFGPFKIHWRRVCHDFQVSHQGKVVNEYNFCCLLSKAWLESMTTINIVAGFQTTGIYPVNRDAVQLPGENSSEAIIAPRPVFTPFKRSPLEDGLFSSDDVPQKPRIHVDLAKRPSALANILDQKTPQVKTQRIKPDPSDMVLTSIDFRNKQKAQKETKGMKTPKKATSTPRNGTRTPKVGAKETNSKCECFIKVTGQSLHEIYCARVQEIGIQFAPFTKTLCTQHKVAV